MDLDSIPIKAEVFTGDTLYVGESVVAISAGQFLQIRYGTMASFVTETQEQCPEGKKWSVRLLVEITETDA